MGDQERFGFDLKPSTLKPPCGGKDGQFAGSGRFKQNPAFLLTSIRRLFRLSSTTDYDTQGVSGVVTTSVNECLFAP